MLEGVKKYSCSINSLYQQLINAGFNYFVLINNSIINLNNIKSIHIKYYQYAGISILESIKENAEMCLLNIVCKNGKTESISFNSDREAEKMYHKIDSKLTDLRNSQVDINQ